MSEPTTYEEALPVWLRPFATLGDQVLYLLTDFGRMGIFLTSAILGLFRRPFRFRELVKQLNFIGTGSIAVIFFTALSSGMVLGLQGYYSLHKFGAEGMLGSAVSLTLIMELGPVLTALVVGGRVSAAIAAELGTMKVTEQLDAMEMIAIDPVEFLVLPRLVATTIMLPVLAVFADFLAIGGGMVVAKLVVGVSFNTFEEGLTMFFRYQDLVGGLLKTFVFGFIIALMGCYHGFNTKEGAEGVGVATMKAVVYSCLLILVANYVLAFLIFNVLFGFD